MASAMRLMQIASAGLSIADSNDCRSLAR